MLALYSVGLNNCSDLKPVFHNSLKSEAAQKYCAVYEERSALTPILNIYCIIYLYTPLNTTSVFSAAVIEVLLKRLRCTTST